MDFPDLDKVKPCLEKSGEPFLLACETVLVGFMTFVCLGTLHWVSGAENEKQS